MNREVKSSVRRHTATDRAGILTQVCLTPKLLNYSCYPNSEESILFLIGKKEGTKEEMKEGG